MDNKQETQAIYGRTKYGIVNYGVVDTDSVDTSEPIVSVSELKVHLRLEGLDVNDEELSLFIEVATEYANIHNERTATNKYTKANASSSVRLAIMMLASHYYENREATIEKISKQTEFGVKALLNLCRENFTV